MEWRQSIYGDSYDGWSDLADWMVHYDLFSPKVQWMIQFPRIYRIFAKYKKARRGQRCSVHGLHCVVDTF